MVILVKDSCIDSLESDLMACFVLKQHHHQRSHLLAWKRRKQVILLQWTSDGDHWRNTWQSWDFGLLNVTDIQIRVIKRVIQWRGFISLYKWRLEGVDQGWQIYGESAHDSKLAAETLGQMQVSIVSGRIRGFLSAFSFLIEKHGDRNYKKPNLTALMASAEGG